MMTPCRSLCFPDYDNLNIYKAQVSFKELHDILEIIVVSVAIIVKVLSTVEVIYMIISIYIILAKVNISIPVL